MIKYSSIEKKKKKITDRKIKVNGEWNEREKKFEWNYELSNCNTVDPQDRNLIFLPKKGTETTAARRHSERADLWQTI